MNELLSDLLIAVITAAVPVLTAFAITYIKRVAANVAAETDDVKAQGYITEIADAVSAAVAATSQTYVDALKQAGKFDLEAQKEAAQKARSPLVWRPSAPLLRRLSRRCTATSPST